MVVLYRRTKLILTLGPSLDDRDTLVDMVKQGANVFRINFSHGTYADHYKRVQLVKEVSTELGVVTGILADLQGPKIRIAQFEKSEVILYKGQDFFIETALDSKSPGTSSGVFSDYAALVSDVTVGSVILLRDGSIALEVISINGSRVNCRVLKGGLLRDNAGLNLQGGGISASAISQKDMDDARYSIELGVDFVALSFVKSDQDIRTIRSFYEQHDYPITIVSKIERIEALENLDAIVQVSDAVMVARGDLGVEVGYADLPSIQKNIIKTAKKYAKPVIVATQILESMCTSPVPTRAEVSDVANAILDGADTLMLSSESAIGDFPREALEVLNESSLSAEKYMINENKIEQVAFPDSSLDVSIAYSAIYLSQNVPISAIVALTESGETAFWMSRSYTNVPIIALTPDARSQRRLLLFKGVHPYTFDYFSKSSSELYSAVIDFVRDRFSVKVGSYILLTRGQQIGIPGKTNSLRLIEVL